MDDRPIRILLVDDDEDERVIVRDFLRDLDRPFDLDWEPDPTRAFDKAAAGAADILLVDYRLGPHNGLDLIRRLREQDIRTPAVLLTGQGDHAVDLLAMEAGASDYLAKGQLSASLLERSIRYALEHHRNREALRESHRRIEEAFKQLRDNQAQLVQSARLASIGQLAAGVAHEINNPLTVILGLSEGVRRRIPPDDPAAAPLAAIEREALRVRDLVRNLLSFSRQKEAPETIFDVAPVLADALALLEAEAVSRGVEIRRELPGSPLRVRGVPPQLQQVIINLGSNALDAMSAGGLLTIRAERSVEGRQAWVRIEVTDTGTGIPPEAAPRVFDPFFTTKDPGRGTGLGLTIVHEIVTRHGGRIAFAPAPGQGTRFTLLLPEAGAAPAPGGAP